MEKHKDLIEKIFKDQSEVVINYLGKRYDPEKRFRSEESFIKFMMDNVRKDLNRWRTEHRLPLNIYWQNRLMSLKPTCSYINQINNLLFCINIMNGKVKLPYDAKDRTYR